MCFTFEIYSENVIQVVGDNHKFVDLAIVQNQMQDRGSRYLSEGDQFCSVTYRPSLPFNMNIWMNSIEVLSEDSYRSVWFI
jgi:hypothetical protein